MHIDAVQNQPFKTTVEQKDQKERAKLFEQIKDNDTRKVRLFKTSEACLTGHYFKQKAISRRSLK